MNHENARQVPSLQGFLTLCRKIEHKNNHYKSICYAYTHDLFEICYDFATREQILLISQQERQNLFPFTTQDLAVFVHRINQRRDVIGRRKLRNAVPQIEHVSGVAGTVAVEYFFRFGGNLVG